MSIRRTTSLAAVGIAAATAVTGCSGTGFTDRFTDEIESSNGTGVALAGVVDEGDSFLIVCPYDTDIDERLGFEWADAPETFSSESFQTIAVVDDGAVESSHSIWFGDIHLCGADMRDLISVDEPLDFSQNAAGTWVLVR